MIRADEGVGFLLRYENVAWYENGQVRILDRRVFPIRTEYVICKSYMEVAKAIKDMVTQSAGPYTAAAMGMVLAAYEARNENRDNITSFLKTAAYELSHARVTTSKAMEQITDTAYGIAMDALNNGEDVVEKLREYAINRINNNYLKYERTASYLFDRIPDDGVILTQCFAETVLAMLFKKIRETGKNVKVICAETRPYFQGARLTASLANEMGLDTTVITDNMVAYALEHMYVDLFTSAADVITMDGSVINKIGTNQIALLAKYYGVPYYVTGEPSLAYESAGNVVIEQRDPEQVLSFMGTKIVEEGVKGVYPAFDITPANLIRGVVTDKGILKPDELYKYYK